jgi:hypothetical protein
MLHGEAAFVKIKIYQDSLVEVLSTPKIKHAEFVISLRGLPAEDMFAEAKRDWISPLRARLGRGEERPVASPSATRETHCSGSDAR